MNFQLSTLDRANDGLGMTIAVSKTGKTKQGTFARAVAFGSRDIRIQMGQMMHVKWLQNGQYRPLVTDILTCGLVPKSALPYVEGLVPTNGPVNKEQLIGLCRAVEHATSLKRDKNGDPVAVKGDKAFVLELVVRIAHEGDKDTVDAE